MDVSENLITFTNEPKLSGHEADKEFDAKRIALVPLVKEFISAHSIFRDSGVTVTFSEKGISSLVCFIKTPEKKLVLKIPFNKKVGAGEALFLTTWEAAGVKVPHVFEEGELHDYSYLLMEYIDAPLLGDAYTQKEFAEKGIYAEMGRTLRLMHTPKAKGYGFVIDGHGEYANFKDWLCGPGVEKMVAYVQKHSLLTKEHGLLSDMCEILIAHVEKSDSSSYCHDDFGASNIFATQPITVFDPNPKFNDNYIDLGRTLVLYIRKGIYPKQLVEAYFEDTPSDEKVLRASIYINTIVKLPYMHQTGKSELIQNVQRYLAKG